MKELPSSFSFLIVTYYIQLQILYLKLEATIFHGGGGLGNGGHSAPGSGNDALLCPVVADATGYQQGADMDPTRVCALAHLILTAALERRGHYSLHFTDEEAEALPHT
jgi:hypothetical protein